MLLLDMDQYQAQDQEHVQIIVLQLSGLVLKCLP